MLIGNRASKPATNRMAVDAMARRWLPPVAQVMAPYINGPMIEAKRVAKVHKPKNSASCLAGANMPAMARPADCEDPMQAPAIAAAHQKPPLLVVSAAMMHVAIQPASVKASARLCPMRSCQKPKANAPAAAAMLSTKISTMVSDCTKPITCSA